MSDPVTNAEVEDVLSSIRRLVSEDKRPMQAPNPQQPADRLVLTPALRVAEDAEPEAPKAEAADSADDSAAVQERQAMFDAARRAAEAAQEADIAAEFGALSEVAEPAAEPAAEPVEDASADATEEAPRAEIPNINSLVTDDHALDVYGDGDHSIQEDLAEQESLQQAGFAPRVRPDDAYGFDSDDDSYDAEDDSYLLKSVLDAETSEEATETAPEAPAPAEDRLADDEAPQEPPEASAEEELSDDLRLSLEAAISRDNAREALGAAPQEMPDVSDPPDALDALMADRAEAAPEVSLMASESADRDESTDNSEIAEIPEAPMAEDVVEQAPQPEGEKTISLSSKIAALETAIGKIADTWEPDDPGDSDYAGEEPEAMAWQDDIETAPADKAPVEMRFAQRPPEALEEIEEAVLVDAPAAPAPQEPPAAAPEAPVQAEAAETPEAPAAAAEPPASEIDLAAEEQLLDEDALRDLVSEIVRAELQGALGERITRNVRKLVRREIHRALSAQDLE